MPESVRLMIRKIQAEVRDRALVPVRGAELLTRLTALYGNVLDEVRIADLEYNAVLLEALTRDEPAARAKVRAMGSQQYSRAREAKDTERLTLELIRSLKKFLTLQAEEIRR